MQSNIFLITGCKPANNEKDVATNSDITISFRVHMNASTINDSNIRLKKANGNEVTARVTYNSSEMKATIDPLELLEPGVSYQVHVIGGTSGIKSITGEYLPETRVDHFTTAYGNILSPPKDLAVSVLDGYPKARWEAPDFYSSSSPLLYRVVITSSNINPNENPGAILWPSEHDMNETTSNGMNISAKFTEGNYYLYVRALNGGNESDWVSSQFLVEGAVAVPTEPTAPTDPTETTDPTTEAPPPMEASGYFEIVDTYPKENSADINPEKIIVVMSDFVDPASVTPGSLYFVAKGSRGTLSYVDFLSEFSSSKAVPATGTIEGRVIYLTPTTPLDNDAEYTVVIRETVASTSGETLGEPYSWSFLSEFTYLYGDAESIRNDVGGFIDNLTDRILYKYMADVSRKAYDIVSTVQTSSTTFNADDYADGKAPFHVHQYVRYQTEYDLLLNAYIQQSSGGSGSGAGSASSIRLGDLQVEGSSSSNGGSDEAPDVTAVLRSLKDRSKHWEDAIHGHHNRGYAKPVSVVKGETGSPYPEFLTRAEFSELGE